ncbi:MAG: hypothetical protein AB4372_21645 [Xenococcus sp. (in: cyanobacteria)]
MILRKNSTFSQPNHQGFSLSRTDVKTITATFDGEYLRPDNPVDLQPNQRYQEVDQFEQRQIR